ncbi:unnamed protein product [Heligmosomoides polygyrus]|uniref:HTH_48 domain-containing protein n=1 Tax=Heligmosomoides polygyrus TaxID=6339 RepID=A0A183GIQ3_HELPZ|nr:unnamed protein product [Heligmosomoides polygyrus]
MAEEVVLAFEQVRLFLLYEFRKQSSAEVPVDSRSGMSGSGTVSYDTAKVWFRELKNGDLFGGPTTVWNISCSE